MISILEEQLNVVREICRKHAVARLEVFGSAADPASFDPQRSDVDFIVTFSPGADLGPWLAQYFQLRDELQQLLKRTVELVMASAINNPSFLLEANQSRQVIYAASDAEAA